MCSVRDAELHCRIPILKPATFAVEGTAQADRFVPMRRMSGESLGAALQRLDPESGLRVRIITFKLLAVVSIALALVVRRGYPLFAMV
jgi:hypothetical protein